MPTSERQIPELIELARRGDRKALDALITSYRPYLGIVAQREIGPALARRQDPSDVVQQTCIEAVKAMPAFEGTAEPQFTAWIVRILKRNVSNLIRDNRAGKRDLRREVAPPADQDGSASINWFGPVADGASPSEQLILGEAAIELAAALEALAPDQRTAVTMRYLEGSR